MSALMVGIMPGLDYDVADVTVPRGSTLYLFSDGICEILTAEQTRWSLTDFEPLLVEPQQPNIAEADRLLNAVKQAAGSRPFDDDASLMVLMFP
jgi:sigma-B regulation protein RsbU (phosphoserine phosphatase)